MARVLATGRRFRAAFLLLGVVIAVPVGLVTEKLGAAVLVMASFSIAGGFCKAKYVESLPRE
jgi:hypothetical protein